MATANSNASSVESRGSQWVSNINFGDEASQDAQYRDMETGDLQHQPSPSRFREEESSSSPSSSSSSSSDEMLFGRYSNTNRALEVVEEDDDSSYDEESSESIESFEDEIDTLESWAPTDRQLLCLVLLISLALGLIGTIIFYGARRRSDAETNIFNNP